MSLALFNLIVIFFANLQFFQPNFDKREIVMDYRIEGVPPYSAGVEKLIADPEFAAKCLFEARSIADEIGIEIRNPNITYNEKFGPVWRASYAIPDGVNEHVNMIIFWQLEDGTLAKFIGSNLYETR